MSLRKIQAQLSSAQEEFRARVERVADAARLEMLPYLQKRGWRFRAGNGTYVVFDARGTDRTDRLPARLRSMLSLDIDGSTSLGDVIRDIDPAPSSARRCDAALRGGKRREEAGRRKLCAVINGQLVKYAAINTRNGAKP